MRLRQLLDPGLTPETALNIKGENAAADPDILALTADSRDVRPGTLFAALAGAKVDGRAFIEQAVEQGAAAILTDPSEDARETGVPLILDPNPRRRLALMAARFYGRQPQQTVAVTGTNGKTSVASFVRQIWRALGHPAAALGTLGLDAPGFAGKAGLTTPDPVQLQALLAELSEAGIDHLALEASSHGLDQHRLDGVELKAAAFTNLSRDHFDYHGGEKAYFQAKARLFQDLLPKGATAVLNADIPEFPRLKAIAEKRGQKVLTFGERADAITLIDRQPDAEGQTLTLSIEGHHYQCRTGLVGDFQAQNLLAALALVLATSDQGPERVAPLLSDVKGAPGRLQRVEGREPMVSVFIDYAHTPDALAHVLAALRPHVEKNLSVVFGCGGDRDTGKRPEMGKIAVEHADRVFITDDNPRSERPELIRRAILGAAPGAIEIADRADAIHRAVMLLDVGDGLVIAGKGHETGQIVGSETLPFNDLAVAKAALAERSKRASDPAATKHGYER